MSEPTTAQIEMLRVIARRNGPVAELAFLTVTNRLSELSEYNRGLTARVNEVQREHYRHNDLLANQVAEAWERQQEAWDLRRQVKRLEAEADELNERLRRWEP